VALDGGTDAAADADAAPCMVSAEISACPPLVEPECDARVLDSCSDQVCASGCESFLRCEKGDWSAAYVAYCDEDGNLVRPPP
jgi:hypothetical protein